MTDKKTCRIKGCEDKALSRKELGFGDGTLCREHAMPTELTQEEHDAILYRSGHSNMARAIGKSGVKEYLGRREMDKRMKEAGIPIVDSDYRVWGSDKADDL